MNQVANVTTKTSLDKLPNDCHALKQMVLTLLGQIDDLNGQLYYLRRQMFGKKSEKLNPAQLLLFQDLYDDVKSKLEEQNKDNDKNESPRRRPNSNHTGRNPFPEDLPRDTIVIEPSEEEKICPECHCEKQCIGQEVTEKLDYVPASFRVKRYVRNKYACKPCGNQVSIAELPPMVIDKGIAAEGLLSHVITSKYADHLPLKRLEGILKRYGVVITVSSLCDWVGSCADLLTPLVTRMHEKILTSPKIHTDSTSVPIKSKKRKGSTYKGYLWAYIDDDHHVVFDFTPTHSRHGPIEFLKDYSGYLQADAHSSYDEFFQNSNATEVGCHAHARRKFDQALDSDPVRASQVLVLWKELYAIEKQAKTDQLGCDALLELRQKRSLPILDKIHTLLMAWKDEVLPKSPTGKAITYSLNQWQALLEYTKDGILDIDNNLSERTLRTVAIGRKNWMFAGSESGAQRAAVIYSLVASCKLNGLDPYAYFRDVLARISTTPSKDIDSLLPSNWTKPSDA
jgi:transposase